MKHLTSIRLLQIILLSSILLFSVFHFTRDYPKRSSSLRSNIEPVWIGVGEINPIKPKRINPHSKPMPPTQPLKQYNIETLWQIHDNKTSTTTGFAKVACVADKAERSFRMWDTQSCDDMQIIWQVCTHANDTNHNTIMKNCPVTCAKYRNEPCPVFRKSTKQEKRNKRNINKRNKNKKNTNKIDKNKKNKQIKNKTSTEKKTTMGLGNKDTATPQLPISLKTIDLPSTLLDAHHYYRPLSTPNFSEIKLRHTEYKYCANHMAIGKSLITLFTTLHPSKDKLKILAQKNVLQTYATLAPLIKGIIFTSDSYWKNYAKDLGLQVIEPTGQMLNPHGTPYLFEMYTKVFAISDSYFAGYSNADILFSEDFVTTLCSIKQAIEHNKIREKILLVGKRLNHQLKENHIITTETTATLLSKTLLKWAKATDFFFPNAQDYFVITRKTFDLPSLPKYVIGRPAYDNCLVSMSVEDPDIDTIDGSLSIHAVHQTGSDGNFAGHTKKLDTNWNMQRCTKGWKHGSTDFCNYYSVFHNGKVSIYHRSTEDTSQETLKQHV